MTFTKRETTTAEMSVGSCKVKEKTLVGNAREGSGGRGGRKVKSRLRFRSFLSCCMHALSPIATDIFFAPPPPFYGTLVINVNTILKIPRIPPRRPHRPPSKLLQP